MHLLISLKVPVLNGKEQQQKITMDTTEVGSF